MTTVLTLDRYLAGLERAAAALVADVESAGLDADVPTCPSWDAHALLAHQAMVHRWAAAQITGADHEGLPSQTELRESCDDLVGYYRTGVAELLDALSTAPADLAAMTFLNDAPPPREFWARRQTHETTIHGVDARAAVLGRRPLAVELDIADDVALDGLDELLCGFYTRGRSKLFDGIEFDVLVAPDDSERRWLLHIAEKMTVDRDAGAAEIRLSGSAKALYVGLWNRGTEISATGDETLLERWGAVQTVRWS